MRFLRLNPRRIFSLALALGLALVLVLGQGIGAMATCASLPGQVAQPMVAAMVAHGEGPAGQGAHAHHHAAAAGAELSGHAVAPDGAHPDAAPGAPAHPHPMPAKGPAKGHACAAPCCIAGCHLFVIAGAVPAVPLPSSAPAVAAEQPRRAGLRPVVDVPPPRLLS